MLVFLSTSETEYKFVTYTERLRLVVMKGNDEKEFTCEKIFFLQCTLNCTLLIRKKRLECTHCCIVPALDGDGAGSALGQSHAEGIGVGAQFLDESFLNIVELFLAIVGGNLGVDKLEFLAEVKSHHLIILPSVAVGDRHAGVHPPAAEVVIVDHHHTVHGGGVADVVDEVPST